MRTVGSKILRNKLGEYVRMAKQGETILVTDRDQVVAEIGPPGAGRGATVTDAHLAQMVRDGLLRPALRPPGRVPPALALARTEDLLAELERDRSER